jgi:dolichol-phosphate mannosyltransferase
MSKFPNVTIIIPAKNEGEGIGKIIKSAQPYSDDIIVVDGHSNDGTREITKEMGALFSLDNGKGKGDAMQVGVQLAKYDNILFYDADGSHNPADIPKICEYIGSGKADMITCSRRTGGSYDLDISLKGIIRSAGSDLLAILVNYRFGCDLSDVLYSFRAVTKKMFLDLNITENGFGVEQQMIIHCLKKGYSIYEMPSQELKRQWGTSKLNTIVGIYFIAMILKEYFIPKPKHSL